MLMVVAKRLCQARLMQPGNLGPARAVLSSAPSPTSLLGSASSAYMQRLAFAHRRLLTTSVRASAVKPGRETPAWVSRILTDAEKEALIERHAIQLPTVCCGCGVKLQRTDPEAPGHFIVPAKLFEPFRTEGPVGAADDGEPVDEAEAERRALDQQLEALMQRERQKTLTPSPSKAAAAGEGEPDQPDVLCARCHSLRHHFRVRDPHLEGELPEFDLGKKVGRKIFLQKDRKAVVLCVVDITDFDGSLPTLALRALYPPGSETAPEAGLKFSLFMAANKFDLLPPAVTPARIEAWCRQRLKDAGLPHVEKVFMVSATKSFGVRDMVERLREELGFRGDLWVVGAQNAGKSSIITAMKRLAGTAGKRDPTVADLPGTTLGLLQVPGLPFGAKQRAFDTPGVPHPYQLTAKLAADEVRRVLPTNKLKLRTYRLGAGSSISIGGLARLDVLDCPASTIYVTVFASDFCVTHLGKTEGAEERRRKHGGELLTPPYSAERLEALGPLAATDVAVDGSSWDRSTVDVCIAGLGWLAVGCKGGAALRVWTLPGVRVTKRPALVPDYGAKFLRPGFTNILPLPPKEARRAAGRADGGGDASDDDNDSKAVPPRRTTSAGGRGGSSKPLSAAGRGGGARQQRRPDTGSTGSGSRGSAGRGAQRQALIGEPRGKSGLDL